jgi:hypothetical protein
VANNLFKVQDVWAHIYSYDTTYREKFKDCLEELGWYDLIINNIQFDRFTTTQVCSMKELLPSTALLSDLMTKKMKNILPHLKNIGCKADTFVRHNCFWYITYRQHNKSNMRTIKKIKDWWSKDGDKNNRTNAVNILKNKFPKLFWKGSIVVDLLVNEPTLELSDWKREYMEQYVYQNDDSDMEDDISEYSYDSHGRYRTNPYPRQTYYEPKIFESGNCNIHAIITDGYLYKIKCEFKGVKIPVQFNQ